MKRKTMRRTNPATIVAEDSEQLSHQMPALDLWQTVAIWLLSLGTHMHAQQPADFGLADIMHWQLRGRMRECPDPGLAYAPFRRLRNTSA